MEANHRLETCAFACALPIELWAASQLGYYGVLVGVACSKHTPIEPVVSFGFAGALRNDLSIGTIIDATSIVRPDGSVLWKGEPFGIVGALNGSVLTTNPVRYIHTAKERLDLGVQTGAHIVDMESGILATKRVLAGCIRVVSDTPARPFSIAHTMTEDSRIRWSYFGKAHPCESLGAIRNTFTALRALKNITFADNSG